MTLMSNRKLTENLMFELDKIIFSSNLNCACLKQAVSSACFEDSRSDSLKRDASSRWSSSLYYPMRNSDQKTPMHPTCHFKLGLYYEHTCISSGLSYFTYSEFIHES